MSSERRASVLSVLSYRDFRRLWLADLISDAGSFITFIALAVYVHELTGEALAVGVALALRAIPWFTLGPVAGVIADRVDRRLMMVVCDIARAALVATLPFTHTAGQAFAISFASGLFGPIFRPARQALIPLVAPGDAYVRAVALAEVTHQSLHTFGPALGGAAVLAVGARHAFFLDAGTFVVSALLVIRIRVRGSIRGRPTSFGDVGRDLAEGARLLWRDRILRSLVGLDAATLIATEGAVVVLVVYVREVLSRGPGSYGVLLGASGLGTVVATLLLARRGQDAPRTVALFVAAAGPTVLVLVLLGPGFAALIGIMLLLGITGAGRTLYVDTAIAERTPDVARGRTFGLSAAVLEIGEVVGALGVAALADALGAEGGMAAGGIIAAVLALAILAPVFRRLRAADSERAAQSRVSPV